MLTSIQRLALRREYGSDLSFRREGFALTKADLDAVIAAIDNWIDANTASFNSALPPTAAALTTKQKAELFLRVAKSRVE